MHVVDIIIDISISSTTISDPIHEDISEKKKNSTLLALCEGNPPVTGCFPSQNPVTRSFNVFLDLRQSKRLNKQSRRHGFETPSCSL